MNKALKIFITVLVLSCTGGAAQAACTLPTGDEGDIVYNSTHKVMQFFNGTNWIATGN